MRALAMPSRRRTTAQIRIIIVNLRIMKTISIQFFGVNFSKLLTSELNMCIVFPIQINSHNSVYV